MRLRAWHIPSVTGRPFQVEADTIAEAEKILDLIAKYDLFLGDLIESNAQGIEVFEDGEWSELDREEDY